MKSLLLVFLCVASLNAGITFEGEPSVNFVIRWAFQELCDHHYDPRYVWETPRKGDKPVSFDARKVKPGDLIFVRDVEYYMKHKHPKIKVPYFILTHGEYLDKFEKEYFDYLDDDNILAWFTHHPCPIEHERIIPLPLGVIQYKSMWDKKKKTFDRFMRLRTREKKKLLYINFTCWKNGKRKKIKKLFANKPYCSYGEPCEFRQYLSELSRHKFVVSPPGLGPDCYRVWESIMVGSIPIVEHSHMDDMYEGLPVLLISDWKTVTPEFLEEQYEKITSKTYSQEKLAMEYWIARINRARKEFWPKAAGPYKELSLRSRLGT